eukprot:scaffold283359_cov26-Tisochrysis_lutea.AAC.2
MVAMMLLALCPALVARPQAGYIVAQKILGVHGPVGQDAGWHGRTALCLCEWGRSPLHISPNYPTSV